MNLCFGTPFSMSIIYFLFPFLKTGFLVNSKAEIPESLITDQVSEAEMLNRSEKSHGPRAHRMLRTEVPVQKQMQRPLQTVTYPWFLVARPLWEFLKCSHPIEHGDLCLLREPPKQINGNASKRTLYFFKAFI